MIWGYRADEQGARHIGPSAQDVRAAFEVGGTDRRRRLVGC
ncbi:hypothetical protein ENSA5_59640 [Enhygromyxa salina]|uniref:Uncharacterized protein n=1 Tax=Enhygromyxa salina TaxID=215803 RepID=A0A2S9XDE8_9BACT|nr:hypothetical protein [Enhygromyxa salina]PRP90889.1 hypothetical protein ENSA5_59640 [Enhygromyxa salina]